MNLFVFDGLCCRTYEFSPFIQMKQIQIVRVQFLHYFIKCFDLYFRVEVCFKRILHDVVENILWKNIMVPATEHSSHLLFVIQRSNVKTVFELAYTQVGNLFKLKIPPEK